ncbi:hypothetical protein LF845_03295 [Deferribacterales bacterium Es71-Z0220]|uniref:hypothetical protein n=1 Tax=Deferrivibrio essentukiensis TaxID=2880922 RepID=UPI001F604F66|nr:hypothetical protein [Deferrivibrio essentukiensis]MCB4203983.1 hypothetical protein [Deferrivibrio essentukiensis]
MAISRLDSSYNDYTRQLRIEEARKSDERKQAIIEEQKRMEEKRLERVRQESRQRGNSVDTYA